MMTTKLNANLRRELTIGGSAYTLTPRRRTPRSGEHEALKGIAQFCTCPGDFDIPWFVFAVFFWKLWSM